MNNIIDPNRISQPYFPHSSVRKYETKPPRCLFRECRELSSALREREITRISTDALLSNHNLRIAYKSRLLKHDNPNMPREIESKHPLEMIWPKIWIRIIKTVNSSVNFSVFPKEIEEAYQNEIRNQNLPPELSQNLRTNMFIKFINLPNFIASVEQIRSWIMDSKNEVLIEKFVPKLNLRQMELEMLPDEIGRFIGLEILTLDDNQLRVLPESIGMLTQLKILSVNRNELAHLPFSIRHLTKLEVLNVIGNKLESIPNSIGNLPRLNYIAVDSNRLSNLPPGIGSHVEMERISAEDNCLTSLPASIGEKPTHVLFLGNNCLTSLPPEIGFHHLFRIGELILGQNPLIFMLDKNLNQLPSGFGEDGDIPCENEFEKVRAAYLACLYHPCKSSFGVFCQEIHRNGDINVLVQKFRELSQEMQELIRKQRFRLKPTLVDFPEPLFADKTLFVRAVIEAAKEKFNQLSNEQKTALQESSRRLVNSVNYECQGDYCRDYNKRNWDPDNEIVCRFYAESKDEITNIICLIDSMMMHFEPSDSLSRKRKR